MPNGAATSHLIKPKLATVLGEGYGVDALKKDAAAGLTVAVVALPLSMAIAVASGLTPERGLYTAIIGGAIVSALGGSRYQIGGPAGAFILLVAATVAKFGVEGLLAAVIMSGLMLTALGALRLGTLVRFIPHSVTVGFTCAIAVVIATSQLKDLGGLTLSGPEPLELIAKVEALAAAAGSVNPVALVLGAVTALLIGAMRRWRPGWPGMLIAVTLASVAATAFGLPVETIAGRFGGVPRGLPAPAMPDLDPSLLLRVLPAALSFTLLGAIESLLSAKVADGMTGRVHRSNMELLAQGVANVVSPIFGGFNVTGTIARTATNIRAGARSPVSGVLHAAFLLTFMLIAAPIAGYIPLAALAGVLVVVAWNMAEKEEFARMLKDWRTATPLAATFGVTLMKDLSFGIAAGCATAAAVALLRPARR